MADTGEPIPPGYVRLWLPAPFGVMLVIALDEAAVASVNNHEVEVLGGHAGLLVMTDRYPARGGAGEEVYVRIVHARTGREHWSLLAASTAHGLAAATPLLSWGQGAARFTVNLLGRPPVSVTLSDTGEVSAG